MNQKSRTDEHVDLEEGKPRISLTEVDLSGVDFAGKDLSGVNLTAANLVAANLSGAILRGSDFTRAKMWAVDLTDADLTGAVLAGADLTHANLTGADLTDADLTDAILVRTIIDESIEVAGQVRAGQGDVMIELPELEDGQLYRFKVVGDSMEREGILDGDYVILKASLNYWPNSQEMIVTKYLPIDVEPGPWIGPGYIDPTIEIDESELKVALKIFYESVQDGFYRLGWKKYNEPLKTDAGNPKMILTRYIKPIGRVMAIQKMGRKWDFCEPIGEPKIIGG